jgi:hypothetical protein
MMSMPKFSTETHRPIISAVAYGVENDDSLLLVGIEPERIEEILSSPTFRVEPLGSWVVPADNIEWRSLSGVALNEMQLAESVALGCVRINGRNSKTAIDALARGATEFQKTDLAAVFVDWD